MAWPTFSSQEQNHRAPNRWQHRLNRERPTYTERNESLLESADGSMATVANSAGEKPLSHKKHNESTWLRPAFSWKAITLRILSPGILSVIESINSWSDLRFSKDRLGCV